MFWRQANNAKILVDAAGRALVYASAGSEFNDGCIAYNSDSDTVNVAEVVMVEGIDNWGSTEITFSTTDNIRSFTVDGTTYSFTDGQAITPSVSQFVFVSIWADEACTVRPSGHPEAVYAKLTETIKVGQQGLYFQPDSLMIFRPLVEEVPDIPFELRWEDNWSIVMPAPTVDSEMPAGVYRLEYGGGQLPIPDVSNYDFNYFKT